MTEPKMYPPPPPPLVNYKRGFLYPAKIMNQAQSDRWKLCMDHKEWQTCCHQPNCNMACYTGPHKT